MATVETLSPSSDGRCILQSSNSDTFDPLKLVSLPKVEETHNKLDIGSAPEATLEEENEQISQTVEKQWRGRRRKRRNSSNDHSNNLGVNNQNGKRRRGNGLHHKRLNASGRIILPNKFLLGGNITDPLNLNSMMDEKVNRALNAVTPSSSPLPPRKSTIDIVRPNDVTDPLGLNNERFETPTITSAEATKNKKRKRRRKSQAMKQEQPQNSDTTSNSDDQKLNTSKETSEISKVEEIITLPSAETKKIDTTPQKKKSPKTVNRINVPSSQVNIKDPIVSPVVPQDIRRRRTTFAVKRRQKHGGGKPSTSDAGIQTDHVEIIPNEQFRCGSEKTVKSTFILPPTRRRTLSENMISERFYEEDDVKEVKIQSFFKEPVVTSVYCNEGMTSLLSTSLDEKHHNAGEKDKKISRRNSKSPIQNFMNKEMKASKQGKSSHSTMDVTSHSGTYRERQKQHYQQSGRSMKSNRKGSNKEKKPYFEYGNYSKYYGYRNPEKFKDIRMESLKKEWFKDKDVLDIGCNAGHLTLLIARNYEPRKIVGVDIDDGLIHTARNNIRHYASSAKSSTSKFPVSMPISFGPLAVPPIETGKDETTAAFPNNVNFFQGNYVPQKDDFLRFQEPEYDVIMCMSVTKWIHLNWGDEGLIRMFKRVFKQLRAGGMFILEPQQWDSYKSKRRLTEKLNENFRSIQLFPQSFPSFLTREIGFERFEQLLVQKKNKAPGFQRPIHVYYKPE